MFEVLGRRKGYIRFFFKILRSKKSFHTLGIQMEFYEKNLGIELEN